MWTFRLPALRDRPEDIEPNLDFELEQFARTQGMKVTFNKEAREQFLKFATESGAIWSGNFRDLNAAVTRMATLAAGGRITVEIVDGEMSRLCSSWEMSSMHSLVLELDYVLDPVTLENLDPFDRVQLAEVVRVCRANHTLSEAGRQLFAVSRTRKGTPNDADRLRKYLARFGLDWAKVRAGR
jgi:transcriptional regulatory protein RtcR